MLKPMVLAMCKDQAWSDASVLQAASPRSPKFEASEAQKALQSIKITAEQLHYYRTPPAAACARRRELS